MRVRPLKRTAGALQLNLTPTRTFGLIRCGCLLVSGGAGSAAVLPAASGARDGIRASAHCAHRVSPSIIPVQVKSECGAHSNLSADCVLRSDSAHVVHPLAGQGVNLGIGDAGELAAVLAFAVQHGMRFGMPWFPCILPAWCAW